MPASEYTLNVEKNMKNYPVKYIEVVRGLIPPRRLTVSIHLYGSGKSTEQVNVDHVYISINKKLASFIRTPKHNTWKYRHIISIEAFVTLKVVHVVEKTPEGKTIDHGDWLVDYTTFTLLKYGTFPKKRR